MDSPRTDDRTEGLDVDTGREGRDLRDVLRGLVVADGDGEVTLSAVARAAKGSERLLPELLDALEDDATAVRAGAAWALCALADDQPEAVAYLAARVTERVDDEAPFEVEQVLAYLRGRYPGRVADAVDAVEGGADPTPRASERARAGPDRDRRVETDGGVPAGTVTDLGEGRRVVRPDANGPARPAGPSVAVERDGPTDPPRDHPTHPDFEPGDGPERSRGAGAGRGTSASRTDAPATGSRAGTAPASGSAERERPDTFAAIGSLSSLDRLSAVGRGVEERYATGYRCRAADEDGERGVAVRLFDRPEDERLAFRSDLADCLARWQTVGDAEGVVGVAEWGHRPRPWVRTQPVDRSLAERGRPPVDAAVDQAVDLAAAVATLHGRGAVHAGLDPANVVYPCEVTAVERPMLDNVGLMGVFRRYFEPADYLDPRFAAPEYFDDEFGSVDAATDVYGLGAVVYYLVTGRPPFTGSYDAVRRGVLGETPPAPGDVADEVVPARLDAVLGKALAKRKLKRYDGVESMARDLEAVRDGR